MIIEKLRNDVGIDSSIKLYHAQTKFKCPILKAELGVKLTNFTSGKKTTDTLHNQSTPIKCSASTCKGALMSGQSSLTKCKSKTELLEEAQLFQEQYFASLKFARPENFLLRMKNIEDQINKTGTYTMSREELIFGSKQAWRNASRCIGRIQWNKLEVFDCRDVRTTKDMFEALCKHLEFATNGGNLRSAITLFPQRVEGRDDFRVWNPQLVNFAGYLQPDGSVIGDPGRVQLTRICQRLGWKGKGGRFDILPWVLSSPYEGVKYYEIPEELILMVDLEHPKHEWFAEMGLKWYAVPAVADMMLDIGGLCFTACPFNGWYMVTEIGARNLCDQQRYNLAKKIAEKLGLDTRTPSSLWKDTALVETTLAVLYSFQKSKVTIVDHHTAAETFMKHMETEQRLRGGCPADWVWIVPPISASATPVYHQEMVTYNLKPSYEYQEKAWVSYKWPENEKINLKYHFRSVAKAVQICVGLMSKVTSGRTKATILYATETGKSETFAKKLEQVLQASFNTQVLCMEEYDFDNIKSERFMVLVTSTFGTGEPPDNGKTFWKEMMEVKDSGLKLHSLKYAVFALGSSQYPNFCQFGKDLDSILNDIGAHKIMPLEMGDELGGQEHVFHTWLPEVYMASCKDFGIHINEDIILQNLNCNTWKLGKFRLASAEKSTEDILSELSKLHHKQLFPAKISSKKNLISEESERKTLLIRLSVSDAFRLSYEPGDHIAIFPSNPPDIVESLLKKIDVDADMIVKTEYEKDGEWLNFKRIPNASLRTLLTNYLDITTPPTCSFLLLLSEMATNNWEKFRLKRLSEVTENYEDWKSYRYPHLAEMLQDYHSIKLDPSALLSELPLLQPRYYSISSSRLETPNEVHITCSLLSYRTQDGKGPIRRGVCTSFLNDISSSEIPCCIKKAPRFRLPENKREPIILVGAGSGIAPFRSFWMERKAKLSKMKRNISLDTLCDIFLFFGCRKSTEDNIYAEEIANLVNEKVITRVFNAFSREPGQKKEYVQHKLEGESKIVLDVLEKGGHIYVCGDAIMAADVRATINRILTNSNNIKDIDALLNAGKYHEDVFGVLHKKR